MKNGLQGLLIAVGTLAFLVGGFIVSVFLAGMKVAVGLIFATMVAIFVVSILIEIIRDKKKKVNT